ncbi:unnamed protein product [Toxocara canis]|uniref:DNA-directed RNA polymerase n=1 Tax=Toxocara canis TaxID=6265 RepID=A0A183U241_TOXCA|nr:unnamed protein product [Toxocara canis]
MDIDGGRTLIDGNGRGAVAINDSAQSSGDAFLHTPFIAVSNDCMLIETLKRHRLAKCLAGLLISPTYSHRAVVSGARPSLGIQMERYGQGPKATTNSK